jgi:hypothetical protein
LLKTGHFHVALTSIRDGIEKKNIF